MRRVLSLLVGLLGLAHCSHAQDAATEALHRYQAATQALQVASYDVQRIDTFSAADVWNHTGHAVLRREARSKILGAAFYLTQHDAAYSYCYNGNVGFELDDHARTFQLQPTPFDLAVLGNPAGQMLVAELLAPAPGYRPPAYAGNVLHLRYPDDTQHDLRSQQTWLTLNPATSLPREVKTSLLRSGRKWVTIWRLTNLRLDAAAAAELERLQRYEFLTTYVAAGPASVPVPPPSLLGRPAPKFTRLSLAKVPVKLSSYRGKVVLLDFWATWCSPCLKVMPEVQHLQDQHRGKLVVLGVLLSDGPDDNEHAKGVLQRRHASYLNVVGAW